MSAKAPRKDGKGYEYPSIGHLVGLDGKIQGEREKTASYGRILKVEVKEFST